MWHSNCPKEVRQRIEEEQRTAVKIVVNPEHNDHVHVVPENKELDRTISQKIYSTPAGAESLAEILMRSKSSLLIYC